MWYARGLQPMAFRCASWVEDKQYRSLVFEIPIHLTGDIPSRSLDHADADGRSNQESQEGDEFGKLLGHDLYRLLESRFLERGDGESLGYCLWNAAAEDIGKSHGHSSHHDKINRNAKAGDGDQVSTTCCHGGRMNDAMAEDLMSGAHRGMTFQLIVP